MEGRDEGVLTVGGSMRCIDLRQGKKTGALGIKR